MGATTLALFALTVLPLICTPGPDIRVRTSRLGSSPSTDTAALGP